MRCAKRFSYSTGGVTVDVVEAGDEKGQYFLAKNIAASEPCSPHLQLNTWVPALQRMGRTQRRSPNADNNDRPETQLHLELPNTRHGDEGGGLTRMTKTNSRLLITQVLDRACALVRVDRA
jgi:hypothetical protein